MTAALSEIPLVEPRAIRDTVVTGIASIEQLAAGLYRLTFYADQTCAFDGRHERAVVARFVMASQSIAAVHAFVAEKLSMPVCIGRVKRH